MTEQEAIMIIQAIPEKIWNQMDKVEEEAISMAVKELEKQIHKKPIYYDYHEDDDGENLIPYAAICPVCGDGFEFGYWNEEDNPRCIRCGQKLEWQDFRKFAKPIDVEGEYFDRACEAYDTETGFCELFADYCDGCYRHCMGADYGE